jgi:GxxExxY protein
MTVAIMELYCRRSFKKGFNGRQAYSIVLSSVQTPKQWKDLTDEECQVWNMLARLLVERPVVKPLPPPIILTPRQSEVLDSLKKTMAAYKITKCIRSAAVTKILSLVRKAAATVYQLMDWGWNEKVFQEALKIELDEMTEGTLLITSEIPHTLSYKGRYLGDGVNSRTDILLTNRQNGKQLLLELKAVSGEKSSMIKADQQCRRYLRMKGISVGMVINFPDKPNCRIRCRCVFP